MPVNVWCILPGKILSEINSGIIEFVYQAVEMLNQQTVRTLPKVWNSNLNDQ